MIKLLRKFFAGMTTEPMERAEIKEFEEANTVTPQQQRWLAFGAPLAYKYNESARIFIFLPDAYGNEKDLQPLVDRAREEWDVTDTESAKTRLDEYLSLENSSVANEIYINFLSEHEQRYDDNFGEYLYENAFVTRKDTEEAQGIELIFRAAEKASERAVDWHLIQNDIDDEDEIEEIAYEYAHDLLPRMITGGVKSYGDVLQKLTYPVLESHRHHAEIRNISNFAAYELGCVAYMSRVFAAVGYITEAEAWDYIKKAADMAAKLYKNWHEYIAAHCLGWGLINAGMHYGDEAQRINGYLIGHENSPLGESQFKEQGY